jgi:hypothetical protein
MSQDGADRQAGPEVGGTDISSFAPHQHGGEMIRLTLVGVTIAVLGVATALIVAIDRFT